MQVLARRGATAASLISCALALGATASPAPALAAGPATVTVRVEGASGTLQPRTTVTTTTSPLSKTGDPAQGCSPTSAGGALELAVGGDWGGSYFAGLGQTVERIRTESHPFAGPEPKYWSIWINGRSATVGACAAELASGDEVLFFVDCYGATCVKPAPLRLVAPAAARRGVPFTARVERLDGAGGATPAPGATITGGAAPVVTGADGTAAVTPAAAGTLPLRAERGTDVRTAEALCVSEGDDGTCGTRDLRPAALRTPVAPVTPVRPTEQARDRRPPAVRILEISEGARFGRRSAPRILRAAVEADPSGLSTVKLRLTRRAGRSCVYLSGRQERFRRTRCGRGSYFRVGDRAKVSYLLPVRLGPGRYVLDVIAVDRAGNRDPLARGRNRVVFTVR